MTVVLKKCYQTEKFINELNEELTRLYNTNTGSKFITWSVVEEDADYMNNHPLGVNHAPHLERPITKEFLESNFFWYRYGTFNFKLSGGNTNSDECRDAVGIAKWIMKTKARYIDKKQSENYSKSIVSKYLEFYFEEAGYDMNKLWELPNISHH